MMRFANIQSAQLKKRQKQYMLGMPSSPGRPMFEDDCNMEKVLDKMEKMRKYLYDMCPKEERESNEHAKESTLVRIISDNLPAQYQAAWDRLEMQMTMRKLAAGESEAGKLDSATDTINKSFSSKWLPPHQDVRVVLVDHYYKLLELKKAQKSKGRDRLPVMMLPEGNGNEITCYACGEPGHKSNDPVCNASKGQVWSGAPSAFKAKVSENKFPKGYGKGAGGKTIPATTLPKTAGAATETTADLTTSPTRKEPILEEKERARAKAGQRQRRQPSFQEEKA